MSNDVSSSFVSRRHFASDNYAPVCPEVWAALAEVNAGHAVSYGDDPWTAEAAALLQRTSRPLFALVILTNAPTTPSAEGCTATVKV